MPFPEAYADFAVSLVQQEFSTITSLDTDLEAFSDSPFIVAQDIIKANAEIPVIKHFFISAYSIMSECKAKLYIK